jgi:hypothetical protein
MHQDVLQALLQNETIHDHPKGRLEMSPKRRLRYSACRCELNASQLAKH